MPLASEKKVAMTLPFSVLVVLYFSIVLIVILFHREAHSSDLIRLNVVFFWCGVGKSGTHLAINFCHCQTSWALSIRPPSRLRPLVSVGGHIFWTFWTTSSIV